MSGSLPEGTRLAKSGSGFLSDRKFHSDHEAKQKKRHEGSMPEVAIHPDEIRNPA